MKPIIFSLPRVINNESIPPPINKSKIYFDDNPSPKLIKYGFNNISEKMDLNILTSDSHYKAGLNIDFTRDDKNSFVSKTAEIFGNQYDPAFYQAWEILNIFDLINKSESIYTNIPETLLEVTNSHKKLFKTNKQYNITNDINKAINIQLIYSRYSDIDIDENALIQLIYNDLSSLFQMQIQGSNMILQLFNVQTQVTVQLIYLLSSYYTEAYLYKPESSSDLSDNKYLILIGLRNKSTIDLPKFPSNRYLLSLGVNDIPNNFTSVIQCMNSFVMPNKYETYLKIINYLNTKVYEGATYQDLIKEQNKFTLDWINIFTEPDKIKTILDDSINFVDKNCANSSKLDELFS
ncbi:putative FtsJ-like methyltransferase [Acanthamoeba castellanii mimivirus]|uniref:Uncharacterized protein R383 n=5 Tax=Mimivirus TaxID=315393 RepID=YR383_MIMIV|nr:putative FtsJ-like methyltransferase [Acanthamoeba polyphaga mimivirus]Q5UQX0.1 RecName: Full=Uncharacterized protein R383 [Acanthamoeba polyphaga mimivirus]AHA45480.1 putative FtsJ-like methyltransferase [Hirudovirus strain Sangsue]AHJ40084.1 putative FtsJ-like methyltransferase [Samba virus]ALR83963.1 putative FtsJ-like methyltransferase [Niemeyer virus]AMZ02828.1 putative FtsJ-like methyltransferase [Mimivirus Bombay]BAV61485.1 putative FtsJ-like methyltransferase [Acanthamoeba castella